MPHRTVEAATGDVSVPGERALDSRTLAAARRRELGAFLRARREAIQPVDVGLPPGPRRRTPGLRREELAGLAGVGVTWYTWLEQGRDINVSNQVLNAIGRTMRLDRFEMAHLSTLAGIPTSPAQAMCSVLGETSRSLLTRLSPMPAAVISERMDLLAYNDVYARMVIDLDLLPVEQRNTLWLYFTCDEWRGAILENSVSPNYMVATYRAAMARHLDDPTWQDLVDRLSLASAEFTELWERHEVAGARSQGKTIRTRLGVVRASSTSLYFQQNGGARLVIYQPLDEESGRLLERLADESVLESVG